MTRHAPLCPSPLSSSEQQEQPDVLAKAKARNFDLKKVIHLCTIDSFSVSGSVTKFSDKALHLCMARCAPRAPRHRPKAATSPFTSCRPAYILGCIITLHGEERSGLLQTSLWTHISLHTIQPTTSATFYSPPPLAGTSLVSTS